MTDAQKILEDRPDLLELLKAAEEVPEERRAEAIGMAVVVLRGTDDRLRTVLRLWPRLSENWKDNLAEDAKEGIRDGRQLAEMIRKYWGEKG